MGTRRTLPLDPIDERGSSDDLGEGVTVTKNPFALRTPQSQRKVDLTTPSSLPPLPPSPAKSIIEHLTTPPDVGVIVEQIKQHEVVQNSQELLNLLRGVSTVIASPLSHLTYQVVVVKFTQHLVFNIHC